jgi:LEA14-like dessication related protein
MNFLLPAAVVVLVLACGILGGCSAPVKSPTVNVSTVAVSSVSLSAIHLNVTLTVDNPNPVGIRFRRAAFDVYYHNGTGWEALSHGERQDFDVNPGKNDITLPVTVKTADLYKAGLNLLFRTEADIQIRGAASPDLAGFSPEIPFMYNTTVPLRVPGT